MKKKLKKGGTFVRTIVEAIREGGSGRETKRSSEHEILKRGPGGKNWTG